MICLGIFWLVRSLVAKPGLAALFTALLFAVHPIQSEAITYVTGRADALAMFFFVFAWFFYVRLRLQESRRRQFYAFSLLLYACALLSKENGITWLAVVLLTELVYFCRGSLKDFSERMRHDLWRFYSGYVLVTAAFLAIRFAVLKGVTGTIPIFIVNPLAHVSSMTRVLTGLKIGFQNIALFFWPISFSVDYSYNQIPLLTHWDSPVGLAVLLLTIASVAVFIWSYRRAPHLFFGLGLFAATYSIVSNVVFPIGTIRADRLMYLPALGLCWLLGIGMAHWDFALTSPRRKKIFHVALAALLLLLAARTIERNDDWRDEFSLYLHDVRISPRSTRVQTYLGGEYLARNQLGEALEHFRTAESIYPDNFELVSNMGALFLREGKLDEAISYFRRALMLKPERGAITHNNLGNALRARGDQAGAVEQYDLAIQEDPLNATAHFNKGNVFYDQGKIAGAISEYRQALQLDPLLAPARTNLEVLLRQSEATPSPSGISK